MCESNRNNYQYRSEEERVAIFKKIEESNLSKTAFCKENGIKPTTFIEKLKRREKASRDVASTKADIPDFIPITLI